MEIIVTTGRVRKNIGKLLYKHASILKPTHAMTPMEAII